MIGEFSNDPSGAVNNVRVAYTAAGGVVTYHSLPNGSWKPPLRPYGRSNIACITLTPGTRTARSNQASASATYKKSVAGCGPHHSFPSLTSKIESPIRI